MGGNDLLVKRDRIRAPPERQVDLAQVVESPGVARLEDRALLVKDERPREVPRAPRYPPEPVVRLRDVAEARQDVLVDPGRGDIVPEELVSRGEVHQGRRVFRLLGGLVSPESLAVRPGEAPAGARRAVKDER